MTIGTKLEGSACSVCYVPVKHSLREAAQQRHFPGVDTGSFSLTDSLKFTFSSLHFFLQVTSTLMAWKLRRIWVVI